jgi:hypothetical protein
MSQDNLQPLLSFDEAILQAVTKAEKDDQPVRALKDVPSQWQYDKVGWTTELPARFRD